MCTFKSLLLFVISKGLSRLFSLTALQVGGVSVLASPLMASVILFSSVESSGLLQRSMAVNHLVGTQILENWSWPSVRAIDMNPTIINSVGKKKVDIICECKIYVEEVV